MVNEEVAEAEHTIQSGHFKPLLERILLPEDHFQTCLHYMGINCIFR
jgi:hypothetical protein